MITGLYAAANGMMANETREAVVANNIANAATVGFRRQEPVVEGFYEVFSNKLVRPTRFNADPAPGGGAKVVETYTNTSGGAINVTDDPLNVALMGSGFLSVQTPKGERFSRNGKFTIDADRDLATVDGFKVLSEGGAPINVEGSKIAIGKDGTVSVDGAVRGQLKVTEFEDPHMLTRQGETLYYASEQALGRSAPGLNTTVVQNALEMSNVNLPQEMISMILGLRAYSANQKVITSVDETLSRLIDQVGSPV